MRDERRVDRSHIRSSRRGHRRRGRSDERRRGRLSPAAVLAGLLLLSGVLAAPARAQDNGDATPQRPSLSFGTTTVPDGRWEIEFGGLVLNDGGAVPLFLKHGLTDRLELEIGLDAIRRVETAGGDETSQGDLTVGVRHRLARPAGTPAIAWVAQIKAPTADDDVGSGEADAGLVGVATFPLGSASLDANVVLNALGRGGGSYLGQFVAIATLSLPARGGWTPFVEAAWQRTATLGTGGFLDAGVSYAATRRAVFDAAAGVGASRGFPDWFVTAGWTVLLDRPARRSP